MFLRAGVVTACFIASINGLHAQSFQGGVRGTVRDSGGVIPGVPLTLVNEQNNVPRETVSNEVGAYSSPALDPGSCTIRATLAGFRTFERKGVALRRIEVLHDNVQRGGSEHVSHPFVYWLAPACSQSAAG